MTSAAPALRWQWATLDELTARELYEVLAARSAVFVVEQNCVYLDADGYDAKAELLTAWSGDVVAAHLRMLAPNVKYAEPSLGRIITTADFRGTGVGKTLVTKGIERIHEKFPGHAIRIGAQERLERFYREYGFVKASEMYLEDGIPHIEMLLAANQQSRSAS